MALQSCSRVTTSCFLQGSRSVLQSFKADVRSQSNFFPKCSAPPRNRRSSFVVRAGGGKKKQKEKAKKKGKTALLERELEPSEKENVLAHKEDSEDSEVVEEDDIVVQEGDELWDGFASEEEATAFAAQFADFFAEEDFDEEDATSSGEILGAPDVESRANIEQPARTEKKEKKKKGEAAALRGEESQLESNGAASEQKAYRSEEEEDSSEEKAEGDTARLNGQVKEVKVGLAFASQKEDKEGEGEETARLNGLVKEKAEVKAASVLAGRKEEKEEEEEEEEEEGEEEEDLGPVEIDWEYGSDLGSKLGEVFDPIDLGLGKEWPKPWNEAPETYHWSTRTNARKEEAAKLYRIDLSLLTAEDDRKKELNKQRKLRAKGLLKSRWDNEKEVIGDNELLSVNGRVIRGPEDAWAAWMADRDRDDLLGDTDWKALGIEKPRPMTFAEKLGKITRAEAQRRRKKARVDQDQEQYLHKRILDAKTLDEVLEATEEAFDDAGISYTGQVERDWAPTGALSSVNIGMAVHRVGRFAFREGLSRNDRIQLMKRAPVQRLLQMAIEVVGRCDPQGVANMAWGLSRLSGAGLLPSDYLDEVAKQGIRRLRKARPQHLANLAGAFASLNHASPMLLDGVLVHASARGVAAFRPQEVAQIVWSCAVLNHKPTKFLDDIDAWVAEEVAKFETEKQASQETTGSLKGPLPWRAYEEETTAQKSEETPAEDGIDAGEVSVLENRPESVSERSVNGLKSEERIPTTSGRSALEELSGQVDELAGKVNALAASLRTNSDATPSDEVSITLPEASKTSVEASEKTREASETSAEVSESSRPSFLHFFGIGAGNPFAEFGALHLANLAWAYAVLGETRRPAFAKLWEEIERKKSIAFDDKMMSQLWQVSLTLQLEESDLNLELEPPLLKQKAERVWREEKESEKTVSTYQLELERALGDMGKQFEAEYTEADYSIDVAIPDEKIAFEVDGPSHFTRNTGTPLGATLLKRRHLAAAGWTVLPINYNYWDALKGEKEQQAYLKKLLRSAKQKEAVSQLVAQV